MVKNYYSRLKQVDHGEVYSATFRRPKEEDRHKLF